MARKSINAVLNEVMMLKHEVVGLQAEIARLQREKLQRDG